MDRTTPTFGGYSKHYVVDEAYALNVNAPEEDLPESLRFSARHNDIFAAQALGRWSGKKVGVVGLAGLATWPLRSQRQWAEVTVFSTSPSKEADAAKLGADKFVVSRDADAMGSVAGTFNVIIDTVSADHDINPYINALGLNGVLVVVGMPETPATVHQASLILGNKAIAGSLIGGIPETQEMLDFCAKHGITSDIELIKPDYIDTAYDRTVKADVRYRFVIDMANA